MSEPADLGAVPDAACGRSRLAWFIPNATVFVSSFCMMVIELLAGRIIARHLGSSLYTWTSIIGVVLGGIAIGNYIGGRIADRFDARRALTLLFIFSSAVSAAIVPANSLTGDLSTLWTFSWPARVASHVALVFFLPSALLGTISPVAAKMALTLGRKQGRTIGNIYAWGVIGSILGTFATGFYLIATFGTSTIVWSVAAILALAAVFYGASSVKAWTWMAVLGVGVIIGNASWSWAVSAGEALGLRDLPNPTLIYSEEGNYSYVQVVRISESPDVRRLHLDKLLHSEVNMENPDELRYEYERVYTAATNHIAADRNQLHTLTIGGGGYVLPLYLMRHWPGSKTEVAEIDPAVTRAAMAAMGLPRDSGIEIHHEDGRVYVDSVHRMKMEGKPVAPYDFIFLDVFDDFSVPYQLTTLEFNRSVHGLLAPNGCFLVNLIDEFDSGRFLAAAYDTMKQVFANVYVITEAGPAEFRADLRNTFILIGSDTPIAVNEIKYEQHAPRRLLTFEDSRMDALAARTGRQSLTDEYAPVENLLTPVVNAAASFRAAQEWIDRCQARIRAGKFSEAADLIRKGLASHPKHAGFWVLLGNAQYFSNNLDSAREAYGKALELTPDTIMAHLGMADCFEREGHPDQALPHRLEFVRINPADAGGRLALASTQLRLGKDSEALENFAAAVRIRPNFSEAYNSWATVLAAKGRLEESIPIYRKAIEIRPEYADAHFNLGETYVNLKRYDLAAGAYQDCLKYRPSDSRAVFGVGNSCYLSGRLDEAVEAYLKASFMNPKLSNGYFNSAIIRESQGKLEEAEMLCKKAIAAAPKDAAARQLLQRIAKKRTGAASNPAP